MKGKKNWLFNQNIDPPDLKLECFSMSSRLENLVKN